MKSLKDLEDDVKIFDCLLALFLDDVFLNSCVLAFFVCVTCMFNPVL